MKKIFYLSFAMFALVSPSLLHAQGGCIDSPECPTAVLGIVGAAGVALYARLRTK